MIGKPEWFTYRVMGWGIRPKTKEGWAYLIVWLSLVLFISWMSIDITIKTALLVLLSGILITDSLHIMTQMPKYHDERENYLQLLIERNCSFVAIASIATILLIQILIPGFLRSGYYPFDLSLLIVIVFMGLTKGISSIIVSKRN